ncbi:threonine synthase [Halorussus amylolyticus]|uniref:threonine synthase n=1 Tax=Halorussus amylolyticus TaxID=1126242 RepID=UPI00138F90F3|nr:threonine synthase [Halorussus amylolyticus]
MTDTLGLTCYRCGATATFPDSKRCDCGEPLWFDTESEDFGWPESVGREGDGPGRTSGPWRYADLLPVEHREGVGSAAGDTPLVRANGLDDYAGCRLWLKDESENPTGSFKDRGSAVGVAWAAAAGREWVGTVSHGNMAISVSAHAAGTDAECVVLVPDDISTERLTAIAQYGPEVLRIAGDYGRLYYDTLETDSPVEFVNSDTPLRVAGQKTTALEICEAFARRGAVADRAAPDAIVVPTSSGGHASASWKALRELEAAGLLGADSLPRLYFVQAAACDPIAQAYREGADEVTATTADETVAYSIANSDPPSGTRALAAARETGGAVLSVTDDEILDAKARLAEGAGFCVEPASATSLAGIRKLTESGDLAADDEAVAVLTGTGFRELGDAGTDPETVDLDDLPERLRALTE